MAHRLLRDAQADGWERSDFPIICESCLGDNPYVRMLRAEYDKECKICARPFTVFRWRPGRDARYKKTEICQTCCKLKNVCQVCLLDLEYGLPVQVRDTALAINSNDAIPRSDVNREYFAEEHDRKAAAGIDYDSSYGKARPNDTILKLQRTSPYYKRNRAHVCSFYVRGECTRGAECPYRHEMPETGELSQQNIKDRYYGVNDPVALKLLGKAGEMPSLQPPDDETIRTLYIGGLDNRVSEQDLRDQFYAHGEIESIRMVVQRACAFVGPCPRPAQTRAQAGIGGGDGRGHASAVRRRNEPQPSLSPRSGRGAAKETPPRRTPGEMPRDRDEPAAVRVYTVCDESKYLVVRNVPALGCGDELGCLFSAYGPLEECKPMDAEDCEEYTDVFFIKFAQVSNARFAKRKLDESVFLGNRLQVSYAPQFESLLDTKEKLEVRRNEVLRRIRSPAGSRPEGLSQYSPGQGSSSGNPHHHINSSKREYTKTMPATHIEDSRFSHVPSTKDYFPSESMNATVNLVRQKLDKIQSGGDTSDATAAASKKPRVDNRRRI